MMLVTQIHMGASMVSDGTLLLTDAADQGGFVAADAYSAEDLAKQIDRLRKAADKLEVTRARLLRNAEPFAPINQLVAAE